MPSVVNTNLATLLAQLYLGRTQRGLADTLARLSSGLRINSARDDAAGLAISDRLTAQIRGLSQAARNTNDGISLMQIADDALATSGTLLQRVRELAVQAANSSSSASDRASLQLEVAQLTQEVDRIGRGTSYNGRTVLGGTYTNQNLQIGANVGQTVNIGVGGARIVDLVTLTTVTVPGGGGNYNLSTSAASASLGGFRVGEAWQRNWVTTGNTITIAGSAGWGVVSYATGDTARMIAAAVNATTASSGVSASARTQINMNFSADPGTLDFFFEGYSASNGTPGANAVHIVANAFGGDYSTLAATFNSVTGTTGVTAVATASGVTLTSPTGDDLRFWGYASSIGSHSADLVNGTSTQTITSYPPTSSSATVGGIVTFSSASAFTVNDPSTTQLFTTLGGHPGISGGGPPVTTTFLPTLDVSTVLGANQTIAAIDQALAALNLKRAGVGAYLNRLGALLDNTTASTGYLRLARSRITDTDYAAETAALARYQILQNSGLAMVTQANGAPANVLALLRSTSLA